MANDKDSDTGTRVVDNHATESRRKFLKKAGRFAVYTPPAITLLMHPSRDAVANGSGGHHYSSDGEKKYYYDKFKQFLYRLYQYKYGG